jgi:hypothetical protein
MNVIWRASAPRWRRNLPVGFIRPCEPTLTDRPPAGPGWLHEIKHDGFRILARKQGERVQVWSRRGADFTYRFPAIAEAVRSLNVDQIPAARLCPSVLAYTGRRQLRTRPRPTSVG